VTTPLLEATGLRRVYPPRGGGRSTGPVVAVDGVSLHVTRGRCLAVVGASGSGKSTLGRLLVGLERPDAGQVLFDGIPISSLPERRLRPLRRRFQPVFQDAFGTLDPRLDVTSSVAEPLLAHRLGGSSARRRERVAALLAEVGLRPELGRRLPAALSGGERQRVALARALATEPELLVLDEPVSSVDAPARWRILDLLGHLEDARQLAMVLISHDLDTVVALADRVVVLELGRVVEAGPPGDILSRPRHPYTRELVAARLAPPAAAPAPTRDPSPEA
jgi:ABC-type glutathione transport system ATPase component